MYTKIQATFKGQNGSMGFLKENRYSLSIFYYYSNKKKLIGIKDLFSTNYCFYETFLAFLKNWDYIKIK